MHSLTLGKKKSFFSSLNYKRMIRSCLIIPPLYLHRHRHTHTYTHTHTHTRTRTHTNMSWLFSNNINEKGTVSRYIRNGKKCKTMQKIFFWSFSLVCLKCSKIEIHLFESNNLSQLEKWESLTLLSSELIYTSFCSTYN